MLTTPHQISKTHFHRLFGFKLTLQRKDKSKYILQIDVHTLAYLGLSLSITRRKSTKVFEQKENFDEHGKIFDERIKISDERIKY